MADHARAARMAKRIMTIVASAIEREVKDQRLEYVTVTDCRVTGDLHDATVFYTVRGVTIDDEPDTDAAAEALHRARGQLRKIVGDQLSVRFTPTLSFELDTVPGPRPTWRTCSRRPGRSTTGCGRRRKVRCRPATPTRTRARPTVTVPTVLITMLSAE